jgi:hypothetical protein
MPGPFPGMDPYLENRRLWPVFHKAFISALMFELNEFLPPGFVASQDERVYLAPADREIQPDSIVFAVAANPPDKPLPSHTTLTEEDPPIVLEATPEEQREPYIEILTTGEEAEVITVIELLSPKNKYQSGKGWQEYHRKQEQVLRSGAHLIEIDLLRGGNHAVALERERLSDREPFDYLISLHRAQTGNRFEAWPLTIQQRLPRIRIPLTAEYPDLIFDMQVPFNRTFEGGRFVQRIDYRQEPTPRLSLLHKSWADQLLRDSGYRK